MKKVSTWSLLLLCCLLLNACTKEPKKILLFSKTEGFRHSSIETGIQAIQQLAANNNILLDTTENANYFHEDSLKQYAAVLFLNTTGDVLDHIQQADFERYIQAGGGFIGIHSATDTEYHWPWYNKLVGAYFNGHPKIQEATLKTIQKEDPCCTHLSNTWTLSEEWYNFKSINPDIEVLMEIDETTYEGGKNGENHPMVWKHHYDGGRAFYTALGHKEETYSDSLFLQQLLAGMKFVIGEHPLDYSKSKTYRVPEENRFNKKVLDFNLDEPMELDELGDRGIIYIERKGLIKLYDFETEKVSVLDSIDVYAKDEDGLLGVAVDPNFSKNNWIYFFYSPAGEEAVQHVSRFTLSEDKLNEEIILLEIPVIRKCCHSGGSLEFDKNGLLYIGIGDNTNPFESSGFAPIDERPDRQLFDAQRSASNTNDLRGKILRIKPEADGSYTIPEGNIFPKGTPKTRPEIYAMGLRNPFRYSIDSKNNFIYWGDIGPDAGEKDSLRGPAGMGEFNQAKKPGYYGWPYSRGNNQMYKEYDFQKEKSGQVFNSKKIINKSPNNTGLEKLPPIQKSMIWYGYEDSEKFPWLGAGGVNPMSGPIYHANNFISSENSFPIYFENKWFIYEWMRDWIYVVHLDENQNFIQADPFMPGTEFSHPMDMLFGKDGKL
ncbi:MAG: ThuA domain-containing protein, partial [Saprospiraceae bacterium]